MTTTLLPCPFCGKQPRSEQGLVSTDLPKCWSICCCLVHVSGSTEQEAAEKWNRRTPPPSAESEGIALPPATIDLKTGEIVEDETPPSDVSGESADSRRINELAKRDFCMQTIQLPPPYEGASWEEGVSLDVMVANGSVRFEANSIREVIDRMIAAPAPSTEGES